ncbi:MAG: DUF1415 domain-containing protein [Proteobacteria bacterium]|jgi:hypothetical protein|nr:DUF1415 domain-containing protein [Pseudomonadota bacterium]
MTDPKTTYADAVAQTRAWVETIIVGMNFCPFAKRELQRDSIRYAVIRETTLEPCLHTVIDECVRLDEEPAIETTLLIFPAGFADFDAFLDFIAIAEALLVEQGYEGVYQLASFHPDYCFADTAADDPANYTNRSPAPMLHLIREASIQQALLNHPRPEDIPERNIALARREGLETMQARLAACQNPNPGEG